MGRWTECVLVLGMVLGRFRVELASEDYKARLEREWAEQRGTAKDATANGQAAEEEVGRSVG